MKLTIPNDQIETLVNALLIAAQTLHLKSKTPEDEKEADELDELIANLEEQMENQ